MNKFVLAQLFVFSFTFGAWSQTAYMLLDNVDIADAQRLDYALGDKFLAVDSALLSRYQGASMASVLSKVGGINIRSNGLGGLAMASLRGTGSSHTAILWEGINLQSPMNGTLDVNLIPSVMVDRAAVHYGAGSSMFGSGAMGGSIHLGSSNPRFENRKFHFSTHQQLGSFSSLYHAVQLLSSQNYYEIKCRFFLKNAINDFDYRHNDRTKTQDNAGVNQQGLMTEVAYKFTNNSQLQFKYWYQDNHIELPNTAEKTLPTEAYQDDDFHRAILKYMLIVNPVFDLSVKSALLHHRLHYNNQVSINDLSQSVSWINEAIANVEFDDKSALELGVNYTHEKAEVDSYDIGKRKRNRLDLFTSFRQTFGNNTHVVLSMREQMTDGIWSPLNPSLRFSYQLNSVSKIRLKAAKSFRLPTFNDLYWRGAGSTGNPDLVPEDGSSFELTYDYEMKDGAFALNWSSTLFYNHINDWIQWKPKQSEDEGTLGKVGDWLPRNVDEMWSYGFDLQLGLSYQPSEKFSAKVSFMDQLTFATKDIGDHELWEVPQLPYTPRHQFNSNLEVSYDQWYFGISYAQMGKQYTDDSQNEVRALDPYGLLDFNVARSKKYLQNEIQISVSVNNLFNKSYFVRSAVPMPRRNFQFNLLFKYN